MAGMRSPQIIKGPGNEAMSDELIVSYDVLMKVEHLNQHRTRQLDHFGPNTCCDYVDSLTVKDGRYGVVMFVEPCGNITKYADSWDAALDWWITVFARQPHDWDYCRAGWYLDELAHERGLPDSVNDVWPIDGAVVVAQVMNLPSPRRTVTTMNARGGDE